MITSVDVAVWVSVVVVCWVDVSVVEVEMGAVRVWVDVNLDDEDKVVVEPDEPEDFEVEMGTVAVWVGVNLDDEGALTPDAAFEKKNAHRVGFRT